MCSKSKFTAIIGGSEVNHISEVPYQLSLQYYGKHRCGGSVISEFWGISAGHCLYRELNIDHVNIYLNHVQILNFTFNFFLCHS